jgi:regulator of replication initiation timing
MVEMQRRFEVVETQRAALALSNSQAVTEISLLTNQVNEAHLAKLRAEGASAELIKERDRLHVENGELKEKLQLEEQESQRLWKAQEDMEIQIQNAKRQAVEEFLASEHYSTIVTQQYFEGFEDFRRQATLAYPDISFHTFEISIDEEESIAVSEGEDQGDDASTQGVVPVNVEAGPTPDVGEVSIPEKTSGPVAPSVQPISAEPSSSALAVTPPPEVSSSSAPAAVKES